MYEKPTLTVWPGSIPPVSMGPLLVPLVWPLPYWLMLVYWVLLLL